MSGAVATADDTEVQVDPDIEARARLMGWKPQAEYRGPPDAWKDAATYVRVGEEELPVVRERSRMLEKRLIEFQRQQAEHLEVVHDLTARVRSADERAYKKARADLMAQREAAVAAGDKETFRQAEAELKELDTTAPKPLPPKPATPPNLGPPAEVVEWGGRNQWFREADLYEAATQIHGRLLQSEPHLPLAENLERVTATMRAMYPGRIPAPQQRRAAAADPAVDDNPRRREAPSVSSSSPPGGPSRVQPRSFEAMPRDAKDGYAKYARMLEGKGKPLTKDEFAADYWAQFEE